MMSASSPNNLVSAHLKVEWAEHHIRNLQSAIGAFNASKPYEVAPQRELHTRKLIYYASRIDDVPRTIACIAGDAIQNLRSAIDHLVYELYRVANTTRKPPTRIGFPIFEDATKYKTYSRRKVEGIRQDAIDAIDAIEPYKGGKGEQLWVLHELNNIDKHRFVTTIVAAHRGLDIGAHLSGFLQDSIRQKNAMTPDSSRPVPPTVHAIFTVDPMPRVKTGDILFVDAPDAEVNEEMKFTFDVAIDETGVIQGKPLVETLHQLAKLVDGILKEFEPLL
jgi:hypothetical protein